MSCSERASWAGSGLAPLALSPSRASGGVKEGGEGRPRPLASTGRDLSKNRLPLSLVGLCLVLGLLVAGCGKKGDPEPPFRPIPKAVSDLRASQRDGEVVLRFGFPATTTAGRALPDLARIEVWEVVRPAPSPVAPPAPPAGAGTAPAPEGGVEPQAAAAAAEPATGPAATTEAGGKAAAPGAPAESAVPPPAPAAPPAPPPAGPPPLDPRELAAAATLRLTLTGDEIAEDVAGGRVAVVLPLPVPLPESPEIRYYAVKTATARETSAFSNQAVLRVRPPPPAPTGLTLAGKADGVEVGWIPPAADLAGFAVYRRDAEVKRFGEPLTMTAAGARSYFDASAAFGRRYVYAVTAVADREPLLESAVAETREIDYRDRFPPPPPANLVALADPGRVRLVWGASEAPDLAGYQVYRRRGEADWERLTAEPITAGEIVDEGLGAGERVAYRVTAVDRLGNESAPAEAAATVPP
jgi:hypothetical protein